MSRLFWNEGGTHYAESPEPPGPGLGRVSLEHDAPVPRNELTEDMEETGSDGVVHDRGSPRVMKITGRRIRAEWGSIEAGDSLWR